MLSVHYRIFYVVCKILGRAIHKFSSFYPTIRVAHLRIEEVRCIVCQCMLQTLAESHAQHIHRNAHDRPICSANLLAYSLTTNFNLCHSQPNSCLKCLKWWSHLLCFAIHNCHLIPNAIKLGMTFFIRGHKILEFSLLVFTHSERGEPSILNGLVQQ